jgi:hypothetical protein
MFGSVEMQRLSEARTKPIVRYLDATTIISLMSHRCNSSSDKDKLVEWSSFFPTNACTPPFFLCATSCLDHDVFIFIPMKFVMVVRLIKFSKQRVAVVSPKRKEYKLQQYRKGNLSL